MSRSEGPYIESRFGLAEALAVGQGDVVTLVGAGGKTTTLYALAGEMRRRGMSVIVTTTTNLQMPRTATTAPPLIVTKEDAGWLDTARARVDRYGSVTIVGERKRDDKLHGLEPHAVDQLRGLADCVLLEGDGARGRSFKVPAAHEPVIPPSTTLTVVLVGLDVIGMPLREEIVHRLAAVQKLSGAPVGAPITEEMVATTLAAGYLPRIPASSRVVVFLNKATPPRLALAENVASLLLDAGVREVIFGEAIVPHECFYCVRSAAPS